MRVRGVIGFAAGAAVAGWVATVCAEGAWAAPAASAVAAGSVTNAPDALLPASAGLSLQDAWHAGGWILWILTGIAGIGAWFLVRLLAVYREKRVAPRAFLAELVARIRAGELSEARRMCEDRPCILSRIALVAFDRLRHTPKTAGMLLRDTVEAEGARQADEMLSQAQVLLDIAGIAPMLGVLGTVLGLLRTFGSTAADSAARAAASDAGIAQALVTTAMGLTIAIPALAAYTWMRRRITRRIAALESAAAEIVLALAGRYDR